MLDTIRKHLAIDAADARELIDRIFGDLPKRDFAVYLWDGQEIAWTDRHDFTITFTDPETFRRCLVSMDPAQFAEAYVDGSLLIEGDMWEVTGLARSLRDHPVELDLRARLRLVPRLIVPASAHTVEQDRADVQAHYDLSDAFFQLFLDERMVYSCAYFANPDQNVDAAQKRKLDLICRKLGLRSDDEFLDVGCGWGSLLIWAAQNYGVRAHGITLSENQVTEARRRIDAAGLSDRVTVELQHYADLPTERFDKVASVGMSEHVGGSKLPEYLRAVRRSMRPAGLFLNHCITSPPVGSERSGGEFIFRHVFPGAELIPVSRIQRDMEDVGLEIIDVEALRPHYALTLRAWFERFTANREEAARLVPERVLRVWDLYLPGCARAFEDGIVGVHQILTAKPDADGRTRAHFNREAILPPMTTT